jgi:hypothetical protein
VKLWIELQAELWAELWAESWAIADIFSKKTSPMYYFKQNLFSKFCSRNFFAPGVPD